MVDFLAACTQPVLLEAGEETFPLLQGQYLLSRRGAWVSVEAWEGSRNLTRRVVGIADRRPGRMNLRTERLGGRSGSLVIFDAGRAASAGDRRRASRWAGRERLRRSLGRQFPGWAIAEISAEDHLEHSLSGVFPRALLVRGGLGWAALAAPEEGHEQGAALTYGLLWLDHLRRRQRRVTVEGLALFVPEGHHRAVGLRLRHLNHNSARFAIYVQSPSGYEESVDLADCGNLGTRLEDCRRAPDPPPELITLVEKLEACPFVQRVEAGDGTVSFRVRGLEIARLTPSGLVFGVERKCEARHRHAAEIEALARELDRVRRPGSADRMHPLWRKRPEAWLESQIRASPGAIDPSLLPEPIYGQVPALAAQERGIIYLLAVDQAGRLAVIEAKATSDPHLPLQALDYWMRVRWHAESDDFARQGYFPGVALSRLPPRLLLVAPALEFHSTTETILQFFSGEVEVERVGVGVKWQEELKAMFRMRGAHRPA